MSYMASLASNLGRPIKYIQERSAKQTAQLNEGVKTGVTTLTTSEQGILGRIADAIRILFGMKGAPGSVVDLKYCLNQLKKHVITQGNLALSHSDEPIEAFRQALSTRATLLKLPVSDKMMTAYARQMFKDALGETLDGKAVDALVKTTFTVDKKGYSKKAKVAMGIAAAALIGAAVYYGTANGTAKGDGIIRRALAQDGQGEIKCTNGWHDFTVPGMDSTTYDHLSCGSLSDSVTTYCAAVLNEAGRKLIKLEETCRREADTWKIARVLPSKVHVDLWWDANAKFWH